MRGILFRYIHTYLLLPMFSTTDWLAGWLVITRLSVESLYTYLKAEVHVKNDEFGVVQSDTICPGISI